jgi:AraC-like DNA-binding protein
VHSLLSAPASPHLREYVRAYAQRHVALTASAIVQPVPATLENVIEFDFLGLPIVDYADDKSHDSYTIAMIGASTFRRANLRFNCAIDSFGIFFRPFGLWQLFGIPTKELVNKAFAADDVLGKQVRELWQLLAEGKSFDCRVNTAERFLSSALARASDRTRIMDTAHYIIHSEPSSPVSELARATGLSLRQYERRFIADVGMSPKLYARIARYQMALDLKLRRPDRAWLSIAHQAGYHDQMHMIKDFELLTGASPERLFAELGDARPSAEASLLQYDGPRRTR